MPGHHAPPPGALPPGVGSPSMEEAMQDMMGNSKQSATQSSGANAAKQAMSSALQGKQPGAKPAPARPLGSPTQEAKYLAQDIGQGVAEFLPGPLKSLLGVNSGDTSEDANRKRQMLQNYQRMSSEQQQYVQQKLQQEEAIKKQKEQQDAQQRQFQQQQRARSAEVPQGKRTGDMNANRSKKQQAVSKVFQDKNKLTNQN
jgi:hypothetical protein